MKTARAMAAAVLIVGSGLGLHLAQQPGAERAALLPHEAAAAAFVTEAIAHLSAKR